MRRACAAEQVSQAGPPSRQACGLAPTAETSQIACPLQGTHAAVERPCGGERHAHGLGRDDRCRRVERGPRVGDSAEPSQRQAFEPKTDRLDVGDLKGTPEVARAAGKGEHGGQVAVGTMYEVGVREHQPRVVSRLRQPVERRVSPVNPRMAGERVAAKLVTVDGEPRRRPSRARRIRRLTVEPERPFAGAECQTLVAQPPARPTELFERVAFMAILQERAKSAACLRPLSACLLVHARSASPGPTGSAVGERGRSGLIIRGPTLRGDRGRSGLCGSATNRLCLRKRAVSVPAAT